MPDVDTVIELGDSSGADRETKAGLQHAVAEMFVLSNTTVLIGTYCSSFTDAARQLGSAMAVYVGFS